ncbi:MAG: polyribonucleotide nucleotidyltransferase [Candidatus Lambdaproteobacteria bacterium]|nr:polyribonucleotide nucleotidyltransferase [Candidatus Lambdaproteobacteria bacterium]
MWKQAVTIGARTIELETGRIARQAHGAVLLRAGNTVLLSTVVYKPAGGEALDFFPLTVDYREYLSAAGRIPGGFLRREGRGADHEVLASRLCDRSLRPLFPKAFRVETQVVSTVLSYDPQTDPPVLAIIAAAAALHLSEIPWHGPLAAVRVARVGGKLVAFPGPVEARKADLDLTFSMGAHGVVMLEGGARQVPEAEVLEALAFGQEALAPLLALAEALRHDAGRPKAALPAPPAPAVSAAEIERLGGPALAAALAQTGKLERKMAVAAAKAAVLDQVQSGQGGAADPHLVAEASALLERLEGRLMREMIVSRGRRLDGRGAEEIRPIDCEVDWLPATHGSALFTRGETQAMVSLTLGATQDRQLIESLDGVAYDRFMLNYHFPPYSVGEVRGMRGPGRREIGHSMLARRALQAVAPADTQFPYTVRLVSEISESNGSSSMATVCGGTLALLDGGVPIAAPVAGIAMGMVKEGEQVVILSDIMGDEDHLGDMDFKVAGTAQGVTALQMDNKIGSLTTAMLAQAFEQARRGRLAILAEMAKAIAAPRPEVKPHVPVHSAFSIATGRIRELIGPGGKVIQEIQRNTGARVEVDDEGTVRIYAPNRAARDAAYTAVMEVAGHLEVGEVYEGVVTGVKEFGAFVRIRGYEGLVHVSEWAPARVEKMLEAAQRGDSVRVRVLATDRQGKLSLSRKAAL